MTDQPIPITVEVVYDDGVTRIERVLSNGREVGTNTIALPSAQEQAEQAAVERRRDVLRQQLDPKRPDPDEKAFKDAQAFEALAQIDGVAAALAVADEVVALAAEPQQPKG